MQVKKISKASELCFLSVEVISDLDRDRYPKLDSLLNNRWILRSEVSSKEARYRLVETTWDNGHPGNDLIVIAEGPTLQSLENWAEVE